ncbi:MAG TPA: DUF2905 domain-containing protein [Thermoanaerobacterales bacterium]|nr:DUF2905 domain-containing protein [Thermoanaerobacterales bacterium]
MFSSFGKLLIGLGIFLIIIGCFMIVMPKFGLGKLPGDIFIKKGNFTFYFPLATCIIISLILTLVFRLFGK